MTLRVVPEGLAARVEVDANSDVAPLITAVTAPAADPVSLQGTSALSAHCVSHEAVAAHGAQELGRAGAGMGESGASYISGDAAAALSYLMRICCR